MNEQKDILESARQAGQPFKVPEGYFESLEDRLMARISAESAPQPKARGVWTVLKPALALAATFALIFGMGYGVLSLTHTLDGGRAADVQGYASAEEELIRHSSVITYYQSDDPAEETEEEIDEETLVAFLASELSFSNLAEIYAQSF